MSINLLLFSVVAFVLLRMLRALRPRRRRHSLLYRWYMRSHLYRFRRWVWFYTSDRRCEGCGCRMALHRGGRRPGMTVHHKSYKHLGRERRSEISLRCWDCHRKTDAWRHRR